VGRRLYRRGYRDKALALHRHNIEQYPDDKSQVETIYAHMREPNAAEGVVDGEVDRLLNEFGDHATVAREVRQVGKAFGKARRYDKAVELYEYNVETYPGDANAMWSQADIFELYIPDGNDLTAEDWAAADAAAAKLLSAFAGNPKLAKDL